MAVTLMKFSSEMGLLSAPKNPKILDFLSKVYYLVMSWLPTSYADSNSKFYPTSFSMNLMFSSFSIAVCYKSIFPSLYKRCFRPISSWSKYLLEMRFEACLEMAPFCMTELTLDSIVSGPMFKICGTMAASYHKYWDWFFPSPWRARWSPYRAVRAWGISYHRWWDRRWIPNGTIWPWFRQLSFRRADWSFIIGLPSVPSAASPAHRRSPYNQLLHIAYHSHLQLFTIDRI